MGCSKSSSNREVYGNTSLPQETRNISNKQPNLTPKVIRDRRTNKQNPKLAEGKKKKREGYKPKKERTITKYKE